MPTPPEGMPWWAWAIVVIALAFIAQTPTLIQSRRAMRAMRDVAEVKEQVKNTHETNLRVDLDRVSTTADDGAAQAKLAEQEQALDDHLTDVPRIDELLDRHVRGAPEIECGRHPVVLGDGLHRHRGHSARCGVLADRLVDSAQLSLSVTKPEPQ